MSGSSSQLPTRPRAEDGLGRALVGLATLGWGLSILVEAAPHEDRWVGVGLVAFGLAMAVRAPRWPTVGNVARLPVAILGASIGLSLLAYQWLSAASWALPKVVIMALALGLLAAAPFLRRELRVPWSRGRRVSVANLVGCGLPILGAPLAVWSFQAVFKTALGQTPMEVFVRVALVQPVAAAMRLFGWDPMVRGQSVTYATESGRMTVDIGAACSGIQAMALFGGVLAIYLLSIRPRGRDIALWTAVGLLGVYAANLLRLLALVLVGHEWGRDALLRSHAQAGWIFFVAWAIGFAWLARRYGARRPAAGSPEP